MRAPTLITAAALLLPACGGSTPAAVVTSEFTPEHAEVFEDGIDFVDDPTTLEGRWREEWSRDLDKRVSHADVISLVTVSYVRTDTDLERINTYRLIVEVGRNLFGEPPNEMTLTVREGEAGFGTVEGNERRLLNQPFIAYIKWYQVDETTILPHWHLAPATDPVIRRTEYLLEQRRDVAPPDTRETVVIHQN